MKDTGDNLLRRGRYPSQRDAGALSDPSGGRNTENSLQSLMNGFEVLQLLTQEGNLTLTDISNRLLMNKTVTYRIMNTLQQNGFVTRNSDTKRYCLGLRLWEFGAAALRDLKLRDLATHHLRFLAEQTDEAVNLSVYDDGDTLFLELVHRTSSGLVQAPIATRCPAHCSAAGKVMLAYHTEAEIDRYCNGVLVAATPNTIATSARLRSELDQIRGQGYAVNRGEWNLESCGIAVPLLDHTGHAAGAIGIACPASRFSEEFVTRVTEPALVHAQAISRALGYREPTAPWLAFS